MEFTVNNKNIENHQPLTLKATNQTCTFQTFQWSNHLQISIYIYRRWTKKTKVPSPGCKHSLKALQRDAGWCIKAASGGEQVRFNQRTRLNKSCQSERSFERRVELLCPSDSLYVLEARPALIVLLHLILGKKLCCPAFNNRKWKMHPFFIIYNLPSKMKNDTNFKIKTITIVFLGYLQRDKNQSNLKV